ncbi:MAG: hypothetical protein AAFV53_15890 [Myxococcota bacterium]
MPFTLILLFSSFFSVAAADDAVVGAQTDLRDPHVPQQPSTTAALLPMPAALLDLQEPALPQAVPPTPVDQRMRLEDLQDPTRQSSTR